MFEIKNEQVTAAVNSLTDKAGQQASQISENVADCVESHPGICLASAFLVGVTCAWFLKQM